MLKTIHHYLGQLGLFWQQPINGQLLRINTLLIIAQFGFIFYKFSQLPPQVPLFYSLPLGESQLGIAPQLFFLPIFSLTVGLINNATAAIFLSHRYFLSLSLTVFSVVFSFLSAFTLYQIITLVS
jgi:hypothetical protein